MSFATIAIQSGNNIDHCVLFLHKLPMVGQTYQIVDAVSDGGQRCWQVST